MCIYIHLLFLVIFGVALLVELGSLDHGSCGTSRSIGWIEAIDNSVDLLIILDTEYSRYSTFSVTIQGACPEIHHLQRYTPRMPVIYALRFERGASSRRFSTALSLTTDSPGPRPTDRQGEKLRRMKTKSTRPFLSLPFFGTGELRDTFSNVFKSSPLRTS